MYSRPERQYELPRTANYHITLPHAEPYRINATDYVYFNIPENFPVNIYNVVVESMSNASSHKNDRFRNIGLLEKRCELPDVYFSQGFGSHASILVLPIFSGYPAYIGNLIRGATYTIDPHGTKTTYQGHIALERTGGFR